MSDESPRTVLEHPASAAQLRLWFVEQLEPGQPVHHINVEFPVSSQFDTAVLTAALGDVVARHEALRTVFRADGGDLYQVVRSGLARMPVGEADLSGEPDPEAAWLAHRSGVADRPFDLETGPLLRVEVGRLGPDAGTRVLLVVHHLVADAWSFDVLIRDLMAAYAAREAGQQPHLEPLQVQYADFTAWQQQRVSEPEAVADLAYWRDTLTGLPTVDLTRGRPRPARMSHLGGTVDVLLDAAEVRALHSLAGTANGTLFMALATLWAEAVGRWFGATDVPIGTPVVGRPLVELGEVIGLFVDRVVLRVDASGRPSFRELFGRVRDVVIQANDHAAVTFEQIVDAVRPVRELGVTPLFQVAANLVPVPGTDGGQIGNGTVRHDLNLEMMPVADGLRATIEYRDGVVAPADAEGLGSLFRRLAAAAVRDPDVPLRAVATFEGGYADQPRDGGAATGPAAAIPTAPTGGVAGLVAAQAKRTPDKVALATPTRTLDYAALMSHVDALAGRLHAVGVGSETPVLLATERRAELIVGMLGVLAAGGAYVPVDPAAPRRHVATVASAAGARLALVSPGAAVALPEGVEALTVSVDSPPAPATGGPAGPAAGSRPTAAEPAGPPPVTVHPENAAYVLFTSGTTGTPKGVVVEHRQLLAYARAIGSVLAAPAGASWLMVQPPTFDSCLTQILGALLSGGTLHLVDGDLARDPVGLSAYCAAHPVDYLKIVPSHLTALLAGAPDAGDLKPRRAAIVGGEGSTREFVRDLIDRGWPVVGHYGPTEATVGVLAHPMTAATGGDCPTTPLGPPMPGVRAYVLDAEGDPVPPGCVGELYVGGDLVARGYANRPARTAEVFGPDPYATTPGARMYRTGDLVRLLPDGTYEFLGRRDRQLKLNGQRIEPGAVEAVLHRQPPVRQAVVVVRGARLVAYVVPADPAAPPDGMALRAAVTAELPASHVPAAFVTVPAFPQRSNGKLDVDALPDPVRAPAVEVAAPTTPTESALAHAVATVLGLDGVSVTDRFFDLGGDSIRAIHLVAAARTAGVTVTVRDVFAHQTVRDLAAAADAQAETGRAEAHRWWHSRLAGVAPVLPRLPGDAAVTHAELSASTRDALAAGAHAAYGTTDVDLLVAAVAAELAAHGVRRVGAGVDIDGRNVPVVVEAAADTATLVRSAKTAVRESAEHATEWADLARTDPPVRPDVLIRAAAPGTAAGLPADGDDVLWVVWDTHTVRVKGPLPAAAVAGRLDAIVRECAETGPSYAASDFPDSGLDGDQLARLLGNLAVDGSQQ